jgi:hypothetical protein
MEQMTFQSQEEHLLAGGFCSWLLESAVQCILCCLDVNSCGKIGTQSHSKKNLKKIIKHNFQPLNGMKT